MFKFLSKFKGFERYVLCFMTLYIFVKLLFWYSDNLLLKDQLTSDARPIYILVLNRGHFVDKHRRDLIFSRSQRKIDNCIFTYDRKLFDDYSQFDAIIFGENVLLQTNVTRIKLNHRSESQIYIFSTLESASNYPACEIWHDNFFNWTFTYRLDSDVIWRYFTVRDMIGQVIAPSIHVKWMDISNTTISPEIKAILHNKKKAAAWLVTHCEADSLRDEYVSKLQEHLFHYSLEIDIYGGCSDKKCPEDDCERMLSRDYYFYIAFENSFSNDYVTEKVLHGYDNYVVPIVYGAANYNRFLPPGSYINARDHDPFNLAFLMKEIVDSPSKYEEYFTWTNVYKIKSVLDSTEDNPMYSLCEALNSDRAKHARAYKEFRLWWNGHSGMKWCLPPEHWVETYLTNTNARHFSVIYG
ncbi:alpha-(1,3)-fucosyltransferase C-like [Anticarsia gemmatalis]|uniref:alpha-(1,3)-fucosyltransferase C-like n=1 Tax=Anticarsia gemmatalis TaxID=129554 RepID=UPI003F777E5A